MSARTNLGNKGLISADRSNKATLLLTIPRCVFKSSAKDLSFPIFQLEIAVSNPVPFCLKLRPSMEIHDVFHVSLLSPYDDPTAIGRPAPTRPPPKIRRGEPEYEVERVLDTRLRRRKREYLVKWKGYPDADTRGSPRTILQTLLARSTTFSGPTLTSRGPARPWRGVMSRSRPTVLALDGRLRVAEVSESMRRLGTGYVVGWTRTEMAGDRKSSRRDRACCSHQRKQRQSPNPKAPSRGRVLTAPAQKPFAGWMMSHLIQASYPIKTIMARVSRGVGAKAEERWHRRMGS